MEVLKKWVVAPLGYVLFLAPLIQLIVSYVLGVVYGDEIKYVVISSFLPWLLSTMVCIVFVGKVSRSDAELLIVYSLVLLPIISLCSARLGEVDGVFKVSGWKAFDYTPVERRLSVEYDGKVFQFPSLRKFENGGYIMKKSTETAMRSKYFACPLKEESKSCIELSTSKFSGLDIGLVAFYGVEKD